MNSNTENEGVLCIEAALEIKTIEAIYRQVTEFRGTTKTATLDISNITSIDTAGVQLLLALSRAAATDKTLRLRGQAPAVSKALASLGLESVVCTEAAHER